MLTKTYLCSYLCDSSDNSDSSDSSDSNDISDICDSCDSSDQQLFFNQTTFFYPKKSPKNDF